MLIAFAPLLALSASLAHADVTVWFDLPPAPGSGAEVRLQNARSAVQTLLGDNAHQSSDEVDGARRISYRAPAWRMSPRSKNGKAVWAGLQDAWGSKVGYVEDGANGASAAASASSGLSGAARAAKLVPASVGSGNGFDGSISRGGAVPGPGASGSKGLRPGAAGAEKPKGASTAPKSVDLGALDRSADPCSDFFQYACGTWNKNNPIPGDQPRWGTFDQLAENNRKVLRQILQKAEDRRRKRSDIEQKIGDYYAACMDTKRAAKAGLQPIASQLSRIDAIASPADLARVVADLSLGGVGTVFSFGPTPDYEDASKMIAGADQGGFELPDREYYLADRYAADRAAYLQHMRKMFTLAGEDAKAARVDAAAAYAVESALAKASMDRVARREPANVHHKMALKEFEALAPGFAWDAYFSTLGAPAFPSLDVSDPGFFKGLNDALKTIPLASWKSYLRWELLTDRANVLAPAIDEENFAFFGKRLGGMKKQKDRWKRCVAQVDGALGDALGKQYVDQAFPGDAKKQALEIIDQIRAAMKTDVQGLGWMDDTTKARALQKLAEVTDKIGYPDKWKDYSGVAIRRDDPAGNLQRASEFEVRRDLNKIGKPVDKSEWDMTPPTVNAYYQPSNNDINFPAGIMQPPFFTAGGDRCVNYGGFGAVAGHELTHGFDDEGRHYDGQGNLKDWWTDQSGKAFVDKAQGLVDEYSSFVVQKDAKDPSKDVKVNGKLTLGENTADNGGLRLAFMAMENALTAQDRKPLNGFSPEQRFFLGFAQVWCGSDTAADALKRAITDPHSPGRFRVNGTVANMPEFGSAFSCKPDSTLAKGPRHRVW